MKINIIYNFLYELTQLSSQESYEISRDHRFFYSHFDNWSESLKSDFIFNTPLVSEKPKHECAIDVRPDKKC